MIKIVVSLCLLLAGVLVAEFAYAEATHTVDWFRQHATERQNFLKACRNNPGELMKTPNCINSERAEAKEQMARNGFYWRPITREDLGPTPWRWDNQKKPPPSTNRITPDGE